MASARRISRGASERAPDSLTDAGQRWVGWPDTAPVVVFSYGDAINAYQFIETIHLRGLETLGRAGTQLFQLSRQAEDPTDRLPTPKLFSDTFWAADEIAYGTAATVVREHAYLFGATEDKKLALARCDLSGFLGDLSDRSRYEFWVDGGAMGHRLDVDGLTDHRMDARHTQAQHARPWHRAHAQRPGYDVLFRALEGMSLAMLRTGLC